MLGIETAKRIIDWHKYWFNRAMTEPDINSRAVFLLHGAVTSFSIFAVTIAFIIVTMFTSRSAEHYEHYLLALTGSAAGGAVGRYFTKKNGGDPGAAPPSPPVPLIPPVLTLSNGPQQPVVQPLSQAPNY